jgi:UDP-GlcNAc:undecaprenyl-phosphate GlcNAc-1-phosphate transferase
MYRYAAIAALSSIFLTYAIMRIAKKVGIVDRPDNKRKFHRGDVPLLGGVAIFFAFWGPVLYLVFFKPILGVDVIRQQLIAAFIASIILLVLGILDDIKGLSAKLRLSVTFGAIALSVLLGLGLAKVTNPFGGVIFLSELIGSILVFGWLTGMTYTVKITDGLDGLATGIVAVGALLLYFLSSSQKYFQPNVALLSLMFFGAVAGFLVFNFYPAEIFLGESGSLLIGYLLGVLAVISGGKVAIALVAMAIPAFDLGRVIMLRYKIKVPIFEGDRRHLHYRLVDVGIHPAIVTMGYYCVAAFFGFLSLRLQTAGKMLLLLVLLCGIYLLSRYLEMKTGKKYGAEK